MKWKYYCKRKRETILQELSRRGCWNVLLDSALAALYWFPIRDEDTVLYWYLIRDSDIVVRNSIERIHQEGIHWKRFIRKGFLSVPDKVE